VTRKSAYCSFLSQLESLFHCWYRSSIMVLAGRYSHENKAVFLFFSWNLFRFWRDLREGGCSQSLKTFEADQSHCGTLETCLASLATEYSTRARIQMAASRGRLADVGCRVSARGFVHTGLGIFKVHLT
jgi:hypothetical protein